MEIGQEKERESYVFLSGFEHKRLEFV